MDLKIKDIVDLLQVSEKTVYRWIKEKKIPCYRINHQYRFNRSEINEWILSSKIELSSSLINLAVINSPDYLVPNIYSINDFKLIINNQIALYKTTGQMFTILSLRLNPTIASQPRISFEQLNYSVKSVAHKKDKICTIDDKIYILITKSDDKLIDDFISKVHQSLSSNGSTNVTYLMLKVNDSMNSADDVFKEFESETARTQLNQR